MLTIEKAVLPAPEQWEIVVEGMRNPKNSWNRSDSGYPDFEDFAGYYIGTDDRRLMSQLAKGGPVHAKFRRMLPVMMTITAPTFWWTEFDTYKVGTVRNSCSKMHKMHELPLTLEGFSHEGCDEVPLAEEHLASTVTLLDALREQYNERHGKKYWRAMLELMAQGYLVKATVSLNYEVLHNIYISRKGHKLDEWHTFCQWIETLPYAEIITIQEDA